MPPSVGPRESLALVLLYQAGAHLEALVRALGRDGRTVRKVLRQAGVQLRTDPPLPPDWRVSGDWPGRGASILRSDVACTCNRQESCCTTCSPSWQLPGLWYFVVVAHRGC